MAQIGRISGPLLQSNLIRNGVDLAFDTDLLYLDVNNGRVGFKSDGPNFDLDLAGSSRTTDDFTATTTATFGNITLDNVSNFSTTMGEINLRPTGPDAFIEWGKALTPSFQIKDNYIQARGVNEDISMDASGTGIVDMQAFTTVNGNLTVGQNLSTDQNLTISGGTIILGDNPIDTVAISPDFNQDILPGQTETYSLGTDPKRWGQIHIYAFAGVDTVTVDNLITSDQVLVESPNTIKTIQSNDALQLSSASGILSFEEFQITDNGATQEITNLLDTPTTLVHTGEGYLRFGGSNGFVVPVGTTDERTSPEVGDTRWNTDLGYLECFDGSVYQVATGGGRVISESIMEDLGNVYALIFG